MNFISRVWGNQGGGGGGGGGGGWGGGGGGGGGSISHIKKGEDRHVLFPKKVGKSLNTGKSEENHNQKTESNQFGNGPDAKGQKGVQSGRTCRSKTMSGSVAMGSPAIKMELHRRGGRGDSTTYHLEILGGLDAEG